MILPLILIVQTAPPPPAAANDDIVVLGDRLKAWRGTFRLRKNQLTCKTTKSSGDAAVDAVGCEALTACFSPIAAQLTAIADSKGSKADNQRSMNDLLQTKVPCLTEARKAGIERLAATKVRS